MSLAIETFKNADLAHGWRPGNNAGGLSLFKALGHPITAKKANALIADLAQSGPVAVFDPHGYVATMHAYYDLSRLEIAGYYVQRVEDLGQNFLGQAAQLVSDIGTSGAETVLVLSFDAARPLASIDHLFPEGARIVPLDEVRLPDDMLTNTKDYLDPLNFATNFALMRDVAGDSANRDLHTTIATANYWGLHGADDPELYLCLFDENGRQIAEWREGLPAAGAPLSINSATIRERFGLGDFTGSLFIHALRVKGHDVVKYALDQDGMAGRALTCSHDANAWPADYYAGMPAGDDDETVTLFLQNAHPIPVPAGRVGLNIVGAQDVTWLPQEIPAFGTLTVNVTEMLPDARWPDQIELVAGRYFVRPRYEVKRSMGQLRLAHANVERIDLKPDPNLPALGEHLGKGYIMPLPILPRDRFHTTTIPTPMARSHQELPLRAELIDADGTVVASRFLGRIPRRESYELDIDQWIVEEGKPLPSGYGHVEFLYDFREGGEGDGWLHALGRYEQRASGHRAETIFGAHIYNVAAIYKDEPQSYTNKPPGLTTRLFLRLGKGDYDTLCHLVYPASKPWRTTSDTKLILHDAQGQPIAERTIKIACGGSRFWRLNEMFTEEERAQMGGDGYVIIRDTTCRLFGFHGMLNEERSFSLDHMFGF